MSLDNDAPKTIVDAERCDECDAKGFHYSACPKFGTESDAELRARASAAAASDDCAGCKRGGKCAIHGSKRKVEPAAKSLTDVCAKCGREFGEHDGKKCPPKRKAAAAPPPAEPDRKPADPGRYEPAVPRTQIRRSPTNPRKTFTGIEEIAESIRAHGIISPLLVRPAPPVKKPDGALYELVAGERRWRGAELATLLVVPCIVRELSDVQVLEIQIIENVQREDVHPLEEADGYRALLDKHGYTVDKIVEKTGKSKATIYARLKLCDLGPAGRKAFLEEGMHAEVALTIARIPASLQGQAVTAIMGRGDWNDYQPAGIELPSVTDERHRRVTEPMSVRQAREYIRKRFMLRLELAKFDTADAVLTKAGACTACTFRTGNQPELFSDVPTADVCTNPPCFDEKTQAGFKVAAAKAKADGLQVIEGKKAEALLSGDRLTHEGAQKYFEPKAEVPYEMDPNPHTTAKSPTWSKLLGKELANIPKVIVQGADGGARELYDREAATKVLRSSGKVPKPNQARSRSGSGDDGTAKRIAATKQRRLVVGASFVELAAAGADDYIEGTSKAALSWWAWAVNRLITLLGVDDQAAVAKAFNLEVTKSKGGARDGYEKALLHHIAELTVPQLRGLMVVLLSATDAAGSTWSSGYAKTFLAACSGFGVDWKKIEERLAGDAKAAKTAKGKGGKPAPDPLLAAALAKFPKNDILAQHARTAQRTKTPLQMSKVAGVFYIKEGDRYAEISAGGLGWHPAGWKPADEGGKKGSAEQRLKAGESVLVGDLLDERAARRAKKGAAKR